MTDRPTNTVVDMQKHGMHFHMAQIIACLSIQARTGMTHSRGSVIKVAQRQYGCTGRTSKKVLAEMKAKYLEATGREYGGAK